MTIQKIGFGTYKLKEENLCKQAVSNALDTGYRLIDTASYYENESYIGEVVSKYSREKIRLTTKIWPKDFDLYFAEKSIERSLKALNTDYIDYFLIHWPARDFEKVWRILEKYYDQKVFLNIGVCNFEIKHLKYLSNRANVKPYVNQVETHLLMQQKELHEFLENEGIIHQAWSPLARGDKRLFENKDLLSIALNKKKTPAQIALRFLLQKNIRVIPKSNNVEHIKENFNLNDFSLNDDEIRCLEEIDANIRISKDPNNKEWLRYIREGESHVN